jgi:hypothetical protein
MASSSSPHKATDWKIEYTLSEPCGYTTIKNSDSIQLETSFDEKSKTHLITGFSILITAEHDENEVIKKASQQAKRIADIITFKREKRVVCYRTGIMERIEDDRWKLSKTFTARYHILKDIELDLGDNVIAQMIENDEEINYRLHHASIAIGAEELQLFVTMFTELFQVIEDEKKKNTIPDYRKYEALRNALSHRELDPNRRNGAMAQVKQWFPPPNDFEFTPTNEYDHNSEKNSKQLKSEAYNLKKLVMSYLSAKMQ